MWSHLETLNHRAVEKEGLLQAEQAANFYDFIVPSIGLKGTAIQAATHILLLVICDRSLANHKIVCEAERTTMLL